MNIPNVPRFVRCASIRSVFSDLNGAIVVDPSDDVWSLIVRLPIFAIRIAFDQYFVVDVVLMGNSLCILPLVVLDDELLLSFLDVVPIGLEPDI